jgi:hypothetical protein
MKSHATISRRALLQGSAVAAATAWMAGHARPAYAQVAKKPTVVAIFLSGGHNAFFGSADSFLGAGSFGVTSANVKVRPAR